MALFVVIFGSVLLMGVGLLFYLWWRFFELGKIWHVGQQTILSANCGRFHLNGGQEDDEITITWDDLQPERMRSANIADQLLLPPESVRDGVDSSSRDRFTLVRGEGESMRECGIDSGSLLWMEKDHGGGSGLEYQVGDIALIASRHELQRELKLRRVLRKIPSRLAPGGGDDYWFTGCGKLDEELLAELYRLLEQGRVEIDLVRKAVIQYGMKADELDEFVTRCGIAGSRFVNGTLGIHRRRRFVAKYHPAIGWRKGCGEGDARKPANVCTS